MQAGHSVRISQKTCDTPSRELLRRFTRLVIIILAPSPDFTLALTYPRSVRRAILLRCGSCMQQSVQRSLKLVLMTVPVCRSNETLETKIRKRKWNLGKRQNPENCSQNCPSILRQELVSGFRGLGQRPTGYSGMSDSRAVPTPPSYIPA